MNWLFAAFALSVITMWTIALAVDAGWPQRRQFEAGRDREIMGIIFALGLLHALLSACVRVFAQTQQAKTAGRARAAAIATSTTVIALALCEAPTLFGLVFVLVGGSALTASFFFSVSLTAMAAHYVARPRPWQPAAEVPRAVRRRRCRA